MDAAALSTDDAVAASPAAAGAAGDGFVTIRSAMRENKSAREGFLWAQFFDAQGVGQEGQLCQTENTHGFNGFSAGGFSELASRWWIPQSGFLGFPKRIQHADIVIL